MVCQGTKYIVLIELRRLGINFRTFELGEIEFSKELSPVEIKKLDEALSRYGLEMVFKKSKLVSTVREVVRDLIVNNISPKPSFSSYISQHAGYEYAYLNRYFMKETGSPIEEYFLEKKNEMESHNLVPVFESVPGQYGIIGKR